MVFDELLFLHRPYIKLHTRKMVDIGYNMSPNWLTSVAALQRPPRRPSNAHHVLPTSPFSAHPSTCPPVNARLNCCCQDLPQCGLHHCGDDIVDLQLRRLHPGLPQFSWLMAVESWKICLSYQDENQQHKVLEGFMDRKDISFYELVKLIEEVGFSPAYDFFYYRKKYPRGRGYSDIASDHEIFCVQSSPES